MFWLSKTRYVPAELDMLPYGNEKSGDKGKVLLCG